MRYKKLASFVLSVLVIIKLISINHEYSLIVFPTDNMIDYQFNLFTVSSVLAGFAFTTLGILLGMGSEAFMDKLKETEIVTAKCKKIAKSFTYFCSSCILSLYFIVRCDVIVERIFFKLFKCKFEIVNEGIFFVEILFLFIGLVYFIISIYNVYDLVKRVYGYKEKDYKKIKASFIRDLDAAKKRQTAFEEEKKGTDDFLEK